MRKWQPDFTRNWRLFRKKRVRTGYAVGSDWCYWITLWTAHQLIDKSGPKDLVLGQFLRASQPIPKPASPAPHVSIQNLKPLSIPWLFKVSQYKQVSQSSHLLQHGAWRESRLRVLGTASHSFLCAPLHQNSKSYSGKSHWQRIGWQDWLTSWSLVG